MWDYREGDIGPSTQVWLGFGGFLNEGTEECSSPFTRVLQELGVGLDEFVEVGDRGFTRGCPGRGEALHLSTECSGGLCYFQLKLGVDPYGEYAVDRSEKTDL